MARFIFDCEDEICLPTAYRLVDEIKPFVDKIKKIDIDENEVKGDRKAVFKKIIENMMVKYPADTSKLFAKLWVLDDGEKAPNTFKTMATLFSNEVAINFFTSVLPSLLQLSKEVWPLLNRKN
jgi:translation elongation factor EF-Ts